MTNKKIIQKLKQLEKYLIEANLWSNTPPTPEQLASKEPFCIDTIAFEQWLQWVFIPQLMTMVSTPYFNGLPHHSDIFSMADYAFKNYAIETKKVTKVIHQIDELLNSYPSSSIH